MPLRPYQVTGVNFLAGHSAAILADEPGLGKTAQAIIAAEKIRAHNILVVCPAIGRVSWPIELAKWDLVERCVVHIGKTAWVKYPAVVLVSYDTLSRGGKDAAFLMTQAKAGHFDLLIIDEGQYLKDTSSKRTKFVYRLLAPNIKTTWVLSGTITPNSNAELYPHLRALFPEVLSSLFGKQPTRVEFEDRFCKVRNFQVGQRDVRQIAGNRNTAELRDALAPYLLRRKATEVKTEIPELTIETLEFSDEEIALLLSPSQIAALDSAVGVFDREISINELDGRSINPNASSARRALGLAKVPLVVAWAEDLLTNGQDKLIVFGVHRDVIAALLAALADWNPVGITGETPVPDRKERVHAFQSDDTVRIMVGNIQAAGTAVTMTRSNRVGIAEPSWVPGENAQAIGRAYRLGQTRPVIATYLSVKRSLDARIASVLSRKSRDIAGLLDDAA